MTLKRKRKHTHDMSIMDTFRARSATLGMSQADVSRATGISANQICRFWRGERLPSAGNIEKLMEVLGLVLVSKEDVR